MASPAQGQDGDEQLQPRPRVEVPVAPGAEPQPAGEKVWTKPADDWSQLDDAMIGASARTVDSLPSVQPILAMHPDKDVILCLAGCGGGIKIVSLRPRVPAVQSASLGLNVPTTGKADAPADATSPALAAAARATATTYDIVCVAGCDGKPGQVVGHNVRMSWLSGTGSTALQSALRAIAQNIEAGLVPIEAPALPRFVTASGRAALLGQEVVASRELATWLASRAQ